MQDRKQLFKMVLVWDEELNSSILKCGESTVSDLSSKEFISGSLPSSIKII